MFSLLAIPAWAWVTSALILVAAAAIIAVLLTWDKISAWIKSKFGGGAANKTAAEKPKAKTEKPKTEKVVKPSAEKPKAEKTAKPAKTAVKTAKPVADDAAATSVAEKPKTSAKPAAEKPAPAKPAAKTAGTAAKTSGKVYHITKRKEDGMWQIKAAGAEKAIKLFKTQKEAIEYCKTLAGNQDASIMVHKEDGSFRKV